MAAVVQLKRLGPPAAFAFLAGAVGALAGADPALAIGVALALAFTLVVLTNLYVGLVLFTALTFIVEVPGLSGSAVSFAKFAGLLLAISWLATLTRRGGSRADFLTTHPTVSYALVLFLGWIAFGQLWAEDPAQTRDALLRLALNAVLVLIVFTTVRTPRQAIGVVVAFVAGATLDAIYGLLFVAPEGTAEAVRLSGGLDNPNELATILVASLVLALGLAAALRTAPLARLFALAAAVVCTAGVFLTGSRGGLVALAVALLAFLAIGARFRGRLLLVAVVIAAAGMAYYTYIASPEARERVTDVESGSGRTDLWEIGWRMVEAEPVRGIGAGNFKVSSPSFLLAPGAIERPEFFIGSAPKVTHNTYLEMWAETGVVGLALFLFIVGFGLLAAGKAALSFTRQGELQMEALSRALFVALAAVLAADFFGSRQYNRELWILLGLSAALWSIARESESQST